MCIRMWLSHEAVANAGLHAGTIPGCLGWRRHSARRAVAPASWSGRPIGITLWRWIKDRRTAWQLYVEQRLRSDERKRRSCDCRH